MTNLTAALLGYSHFFVVFIAAIAFVFIGALYDVRLPSSKPDTLSGRRKKALHPNFLFIFAQIAIFASFASACYFGGVARLGQVAGKSGAAGWGVTKAILFNGWIDDVFLGSYLVAMVLLLTFFALFYVHERLAQMPQVAEFYILLFFALLGIMLMCYGVHLLIIYVGLELMSLSLYAMLALDRDSKPAMEASMKYFVLGALSSGILLFGMSMLYGATGSLYVWDYGEMIKAGTANIPLLQLAVIFIIASLAFKFGLVPFHQWVPDIYQGATYPMAMMVANITKLAVFAITMRLIITSLFEMADHWKEMLFFISMASIFIGYLGAIVQTSLRRFLGYSSIANLGFMMLAMYSAVEIRQGSIDGSNVFNAISADLFYLVVYQFTTVAAFAYAWVLAKDGKESDNIDDLKGLSQRYPFFAFMFATLMLSMAGVPPLLGFSAKFLVINALLQSGHVAVAVVAVLATLIGAYYYLRMVKLMYFDAPKEGMDNKIELSIPFRFTLAMHCLLLIVIGLFPGGLIQLCYLIMSN